MNLKKTDATLKVRKTSKPFATAKSSPSNRPPNKKKGPVKLVSDRIAANKYFCRCLECNESFWLDQENHCVEHISKCPRCGVNQPLPWEFGSFHEIISDRFADVYVNLLSEHYEMLPFRDVRKMLVNCFKSLIGEISEDYLSIRNGAHRSGRRLSVKK